MEKELETDALEDKEEGHDAEEREGDGHSEVSKGIGTEAADEREDEEYEGEEGLADNNGKEGEHEADGQPEAEREGERVGEEKTGGELEPYGETRGKDCAVHDGEEEEHGGDWEAGTRQGDQGQVKGVKGDMGQQVTANDCDGLWRSWETGDTRGKEDEERCTNAAEEERTVEDGNGRAKEKRKRASAGSISEEHPSKRHKSGRDWNGIDTTTVDSLDRTIGLKAQL